MSGAHGDNCTAQGPQPASPGTWVSKMLHTGQGHGVALGWGCPLGEPEGLGGATSTGGPGGIGLWQSEGTTQAEPGPGHPCWAGTGTHRPRPIEGVPTPHSHPRATPQHWEGTQTGGWPWRPQQGCGAGGEPSTGPMAGTEGQPRWAASVPGGHPKRPKQPGSGTHREFGAGTQQVMGTAVPHCAPHSRITQKPRGDPAKPPKLCN